jgi:flagellar motor switch protein FliM
MGGQVAHHVLRRMATPPPPAPEDVPITSSRAIRLAITRAADLTHDLALGVSALREEVVSLDDLLAAFDSSWMLIAMTSDKHITGLAALDLNMRAALVEVQTMGKVLDDAPEDRKPTGTDAGMAQPLISAFLAQLQDTAKRTPLDGWALNVDVGDRINSARAAGLVLDECKYRLIRISVDLGAGNRQAELALALPSRAEVCGKVIKPEISGDWETRFCTVINGSQAQLDAILHKFSIPLHRAEALAVGQVFPLPGCTVSSVKLIAGDGRKVASARLGQSGGMRAVRIEVAPNIFMDEMEHLSGDQGMAGNTLLSAPAIAIATSTSTPIIDIGMTDDLAGEGKDVTIAAPTSPDEPGVPAL